MRLRPLADRCIIKPDPEETQTKTGIIMPASTAQNKDLLSGTILAIGPGTDKTGSSELVIGDRVLYRRPMADKIKDPDSLVPLVITNFDCIIARQAI